jgi:hypothetical protein
MPRPRNLLLTIAPTTGRGLLAQRRPSGPRPVRRSPCALPGRACAAGNPKSYAMRFDRTSTATVGRASRDARMVIETSPPTDAPAVPTAGVLHPTRDIHARVRRCNVHVKRRKSRVERLPIRPLRTPTLKGRLRRTSSCTLVTDTCAAGAAAAVDGPAAFTIAVPLGRVAQWESARFTRERSQVRNPPRPPQESPATAGAGGRCSVDPSSDGAARRGRFESWASQPTLVAGPGTTSASSVRSMP